MDGRFVLFDFDGVIADTFAIAHSVAQKVCVYLTERAYRKQFEGNIFETGRKLEDHGDPCDHALDWFAEYGPRFRSAGRPFKKMPELLKELAKNHALCIVSSTQGELIEHFLEKCELTDCIESVWGADVHPRKDEKFRMIFTKYGVAAEDCIFITDTLGDINEATSVGLSSIGVTWGFQDRATLLRGDPFRIVDEPEELSKAIDEFFHE